MSVKEALLQKGWAGYTISRAETIDRINPILHQLIPLNNLYDFAIAHVQDKAVAERLEAFQRFSRNDVGKLAEVVFSCGGTPYSGTELDPAELDLGTGDSYIVSYLLEAETKYLQALRDEQKIEHQMRTRASLEVLEKNSQDRLVYLKSR